MSIFRLQLGSSQRNWDHEFSMVPAHLVMRLRWDAVRVPFSVLSGCRCMYIGSITAELHLWGLFLVPSVSICPGAVFSILWLRWGDVCLHPGVCRLLLSDRNEQPRSGMPPPAEWDHCWLRWGKREPQKFTIVNKHPCCCNLVLFIVTNVCT